MGQDTYAGIGVAIEIQLTLENMPLIIKLLKQQIDCYVHPYECEDEKCEFIDKIYDILPDESCDLSDPSDKNSETDSQKSDDNGSWETIIHEEIEYLMQLQTEEQFETFLEHIELTEGSPVHFITSVTSAYARNISRRNNPSIFDFNDQSVDDVIKGFSEARQKFVDLGIPTEQIRVGYVLHDSY